MADKRRPDTRIAIESPPSGDGVSSAGIIDAAWAVAAYAWATIDPVSGGETTLGEASIGIQRYAVELRWPGFRVPTTYRIRPTCGPYVNALLYVEASATAGTRRERLAKLICKEGRA